MRHTSLLSRHVAGRFVPESPMPKAAAILAIALVAIGIAGEDAAAELLSSRPITIVIPFTPGASADTIQRIVAKKVTENTGQTIVVESRPGGGGAIGAGGREAGAAGRAHAVPGQCRDPCRQRVVVPDAVLRPDQGFPPHHADVELPPAALGSPRQPCQVGGRSGRPRQVEAGGLEFRVTG